MTTEPRGGAALLTSSLRSAIFSARGFEQDIVVKDGPDGQELYRERPFDNISVRRPFQTIAAEIEADGLEVFLRRKRIENSQLRPVQAPSGRSTFPIVDYVKARIRTLGGDRGARPDQ